MVKNSVLRLSINDLFTPKMMQYSLLPFIISILIIYILFFVIADVKIEQLGSLNIETTQTTIENGITHTENISAQLQGLGIVKFLLESNSFFNYVIGGFFTLYISIFIATIVIGFLTPTVLKEIQKKHYSEIEIVGYSNIVESIFLTMFHSSIMIMLFFLLIPLYFIPFINLIALNIPLYYFFHKMMLFDISSNICSREEAKKIHYFNKNNFRIKTLILYLISLIPFAIFFASIFYLIYLGNSYFIELQKLRVKP